MTFRIEAITLPVADVDRARAFYQQARWNLDVDTERRLAAGFLLLRLHRAHQLEVVVIRI